MTLNIDNSPNRYEYIMIVVISMGSFLPYGFSSLRLLLIFAAVVGVINLMIILILSFKRATIILGPTSLQIYLKLGPLVYRRFTGHFTRAVLGHDSIRFEDDNDTVAWLDVGVGPDEDEATSISLRTYRRKKDLDTELGSKKNCHQIFGEIEGYYRQQIYPQRT